MKALLVDNINDIAVEILNNSGIETVVLPPQSEEKLFEIIGEFDAILLRNLTYVTEKVINNAGKLKIIGRVGSGLDNIDLEAAEKAKIRVVNSPDGNTIATAEQTLALMLALTRKIPMACASAFAGKWEREKFMGNDLYGKTIGIIGFGRIGSRVAKLCEAFGMNVLVYARRKITDYPSFDSLEDILPLCDWISLHLPKTPDTTGMINAKTIKLMKKGVKIVNCARGALVNELDVVQALESGIISGIATDVFEVEPDISKSPLLKFPDKVVAVAHLGASTIESQINVAKDVAQKVSDFLDENKSY